MNPEHQRTNPQRAIDEYKKSTYGNCSSCGLGMPSERQSTNGVPPIIQRGQGRDESPEEDQLIEGLFVTSCSFVLVAVLMIGAYLLGAWR